MSRTQSDVIKEIAKFGERQFNETGAQLVEVLRVKASTLRKYFKKLKGINYLVAVVSLDRVRVYFFRMDGIMAIAENIDSQVYTKLRKKSKLIRKFEKPTPPTELELRMEATDEFQSAISKAIRRVANYLGESQTDFPNLYLVKDILNHEAQNFGHKVVEDNTLLFQESIVTTDLLDGIALRTAFLIQVGFEKMQNESISCIANGFAYSLLKGKNREKWGIYWIELSKATPFEKLVSHLLNHAAVYLESGYSRILRLLKEVAPSINEAQMSTAMQVLHDLHEVSLGTESIHVFNSFTKALQRPRELPKKKQGMDNIHLAPRLLCNPIPLGINLCFSTDSKKEDSWLSIDYLNGYEVFTLSVSPHGSNMITEIEYILDVADIFPKSGGIQSRGESIIRWALKKIGLSMEPSQLFRTKLQLEDSATVTDAEKAVLERLIIGDSKILLDTLIGSPQRVESLVDSGLIVFVPNFNHIGIRSTHLVMGEKSQVYDSILGNSLESTIITTEEKCAAIVSAPSVWGNRLLDSFSDYNIALYPIVEESSDRSILRFENSFPLLPETS